MTKFIKIVIETIAWIAIAASPTLLGGAAALVIYSNSGNCALAIVVASIGFLVGAIFATYISVKYGASDWISQLQKFF